MAYIDSVFKDMQSDQCIGIHSPIMAETQLLRNPKSLFSFCIDILTENFKILKSELMCLSANILFEIYYKVSCFELNLIYKMTW